MGARDHRQRSEDETIRCAVLVVSDSRTEKTDESGRAALELFRKFGHESVDHTIVPNRATRLRKALREALAEADVVLTIGGTGPSARDLTVETVRGMIAKELPGFGELFRAKSVGEIGTAVILSRALLGVTKEGRIIACVPGSPKAVRLALEEILLQELKHLVWDVRRYR
jgi:molybdopterin adenylyltransferase